MDRYLVKLLPKAYRDLEQIYNYISENLMEKNTALNMVKTIENTILSLDEFPHRGSERKIGKYSKKGYRQLIIKNFSIIYRIDEKNKYVIIVTVKYAHNNF